MVVGILWLVVGGGEYILAGGGWWWIMVGSGIIYSDPFQNCSVCLGNNSAKKLPKNQYTPLYIT